MATLSLSESVSSILEAITPGTLQAKFMQKGKKDLPVKPKFAKRRSIVTASLDIKPLSSMKDMRRFKIKIRGKKDAIT
ncbi:MAG: hypothetical protein QXU61_02740, partial [Archaeoglobaceae archaeon]